MTSCVLSLILWFGGLALADAQAQAQAPKPPWPSLMHSSYQGAVAQLARDQAAAAGADDDVRLQRRSLQLHSLYERNFELSQVLQAQGRHAELTLDADLQVHRLLAQARIERANGRAAVAAKVLAPLRAQELAHQDTRFAVQQALAEVDADLGQRDEATLALTRLIEETRRLGLDDRAADAWIALGEIQLQMGDYQQALFYHQEALQQAPAWALQTQAKARMGIAQMINMVGQRSQAFEQLDRALAQFRASQNLKGEADALLLQGFFFSRDGQSQASLAPYRQALELRESLKSEADIVNSLTHLCVTLTELGRLDEGVQMCQRAADRAELTDSPSMQWDAQGALAGALAAKGEYRLAYPHMKRAERALLKLSRLDLIGQTAAIREKFETDRQRIENERLSERLAFEQREQKRLHLALAVAAALLALLAAAGVAMTRLYWVARELSQVDGLTGLLNRRRLMELASTELERSRRYGSALALVSLDLDHFKKINDEHGHAAGDRVLKQVAALCREALRQGDLAGRIGGEEFVLVLPHVDADAAEHLAERLRSLFEHKLSVAPGWPVTASFGVAVFAPGMSLADLLQKADMALYQAKAAGRNRVVMWAQPLS